ncbi:MAG: hypothetical protein H0T15_06710, partial [Thermoleophilaceae bacterium]|nr:hypothetical protein [Thermoleophilaceae bacterium]
MAGRAILCLLSLSIAAALAIELHAERQVADLRVEILTARSDLPPERVAPVLEDLRSAASRRPGTEAGLLQAGVELNAGNERAAERHARVATER